jgi:glycosyltransferase involved in cell wall biosynthesis
MNVVIVDGDVSYPPTSGKRLRTLNLLLPLASRHRLTYIARGQGNGDDYQRALAFFAHHRIDARIIHDPIPRKKGPGFYARLGCNLLSRLPYSVTSHFSVKLRQAVRDHARNHAVDLWQVEWAGALYTLEGLPARTVLQAHNVDALLWRRFYEAERNPLKRWYIYRQWRKFERFEREAFHAVDRVVAVSPEDAALAQQRFGVGHLDVVENGVDVAWFQDVRPKGDSRTILYLGALDWRPNLDALGVLLDRIFPMVRNRDPGARLRIVGRRPPGWLLARLMKLPGVELYADVPDVRPHLAACAVMAVPLRIGGGSRLKILEALASGLPVVSTRIGAEGLALRPGRDYTRADTPEEVARALSDCLDQPDKARDQARQGRRTVAGRYDWSLLADRLERVWEGVAGRPARGATRRPARV